MYDLTRPESEPNSIFKCVLIISAVEAGNVGDAAASSSKEFVVEID